MLASLRHLLGCLTIVFVAGVFAVSCVPSLRAPLLPPPDLTQPTDRTTTARLASLSRDEALCTATLRQAGLAHSPLPPLQQGRCGYSSAVILPTSATAGIRFHPNPPGLSCPAAAALHLWLRDVVQPAARRHFNSSVSGIDHFGTYACRNTYGRSDTDLSEHARANAIDIAGFRLANGRRVTVAANWSAPATESAFLREVRDGACSLFGTTLSPDYNAAHADHFHLDMASRGYFGGYCR